MARGRQPGRALGELELRHLRLLLELRDGRVASASVAAEQLEDYVLELRESGASARGIADAVGVGSSTVQAWTANARQRR